MAAVCGTMAGHRAEACGPNFPNRYLAGGDAALLDPPETCFSDELAKISPAVAASFRAIRPGNDDRLRWEAMAKEHEGKPEDYYQWYSFQYDETVWQTLEADLLDLSIALEKQGKSEKNSDRVIEEYKKARLAIVRLQKSNSGSATNERPIEVVIPAGIPDEFSMYLQGAVVFHRGETDKAIAAWTDILALPRAGRHYRSTWTAFMLGKAMMGTRPDEAVEWFRRVRQYAGQGYADSLGLVSASLGWEARLALDGGRINEAIALYFEQWKAGDYTATMSLNIAAARAVASAPDMLETFARNEVTRKVVTAYITSMGGPSFYGSGDIRSESLIKWLTAVEKSGVETVNEADRFACGAYQTGEYSLARRWADLAPSDAPMAKWVRAKLFMRDGKLKEASQELAGIASGYPEFGPPEKDISSGVSYDFTSDPMSSRVRGELGAILLSRKEFTSALDALLRGGHWIDASYVAEKVLSIEELLKYVTQVWPEKMPVVSVRPQEDYLHSIFEYSRKEEGTRENIRYLLARRLARLARFDEARPFYPETWRPWFDAYAGALKTAVNGKSDAVKSRAYWTAACIARYRGMELLGTEEAPDWKCLYDGLFQGDSAAGIRKESSKVAGGSREEWIRSETNSAGTGGKRFHYRYIAADYAWKAASLLPDQDNDKARILCSAGIWLKGSDPKGADKFYKELVRRCGRTALGREADAKRWFPKMDIDGDKLLKEVVPCVWQES